MDSGGIPSKPMPELKQGEGYINRTTISNNGVGTISTSRNGIRAEVYGNGYEDENGADTRFAAVSASVVNSFIWNNPGGGFSAELESMYSSALPGPLMLTPLVHTTVVGNGDQVGYNLEVAELGGPGTGTYFYDDLNYDLTFRIYDSLLQRKSSSSSDFGSYVITNLLVSDFGTGVGTKDIGVAGIRAWINGGNTFPVSTDLAIPFVGSPLVWTDLIADQFFLQPSPGAAFEDACPDYLDVEAVWDEAGHDFQGDLRPSVFQNRDKGAEEL